MYNLDKRETSFFKEDICRFVVDFVGGGGELNNKILFFLMCSEIGIDRSTSLSATNFLNRSPQKQIDDATAGLTMSLVSNLSRSLVSSINNSHFFNYFNHTLTC